jgi:citryl-CoA lyase
MEQGWKTDISIATEEKTVIRGYNLDELMTKCNFTQVIFLLWKGELPSKKEEAVFNTILISAIEHGITPPSITAARIAYSGSGQFNSAIAAGILAIGQHHGGAMEGCAQLLQTHCDEEFKGKQEAIIAQHIVDNMMERKQRIPGFGHKVYTDADPRAQKILDAAKKNGFSGRYVETIKAIESYLEKKKGKKLCINIDGAIAAVMLEMGFDWKLGRGFFIMARTAGIIAHVHEESQKEKPFRRLEDKETTYLGVKERKL